MVNVCSGIVLSMIAIFLWVLLTQGDRGGHNDDC